MSKPKYKLFGGKILNEADTLPRDDSFDAIRNKVSAAIVLQIRKGADMDLDGDGDADMSDYAWVVDVYPDVAIYSMNGYLFSIDYTVGADAVALGTPARVEICYAPVAEASRVTFRSVGALRESGYDKSSGKLTVTIIKPGFNTTKSRYYKESTLKKHHKIFEGAKMFVNHATAAEDKQRPEGDVNQWVANLTRTWNEQDGTIMGEAAVIDPKFKAKLDNLAEAKLLGEMGISIRAIGEANRGEIDGVETDVVESFIAARSVDFVTYPGAGGRVEAIESDRNDANDVDLLTVTRLRERRPDLIHLVESKLRGEMSMEKNLEQVKTDLAEANRKNEDLQKQITETNNKAAKAEAQTALEALLKESKLPEKAQARIKARFHDALKVDGMKEAISEEQEYVKALTTVQAGSGVKKLGPTHTTEAAAGTEEPKEVNLVESFKKLGMSEQEAKIAAAGKKVS